MRLGPPSASTVDDAIETYILSRWAISTMAERRWFPTERELVEYRRRRPERPLAVRVTRPHSCRPRSCTEIPGIKARPSRRRVTRARAKRRCPIPPSNLPPSNSNHPVVGQSSGDVGKEGEPDEVYERVVDVLISQFGLAPGH